MLKKLLVPVDGSALSEKVLPYALKLANKLDLELTILRVVEEPTQVEKNRFKNSEQPRAAEDYLSHLVEFLILKREKPLISPLQLRTKLLQGNPADEIPRYALEENFDLVIMTNHGLPQWPANFIGSVTRQVVARLTVPALLVHPLGQTRVGRGLSELLACLNEPYGKRFLENGTRFLLPLDMNDEAESALDLSLELAQRLGATLYLLKVNNPTTGLENKPAGKVKISDLTPLLSEQELARREEANLYLQQIVNLAENKGVEAVKIVLPGNPETEILAFADLLAPDAIVMSSHSLGEANPQGSPSLALEIMRRSHLPIFLVPFASKKADQKLEDKRLTEATAN